MKGLFRSPIVQGPLGVLAAAYIELLIRTLRWRVEDRDAVDRAVGSAEGVIVLFWHGRISLAMACRPLLREKPRRVLISLSPDAAFITNAAERVGIPTIRGSTGREGAGRSKGGAAAVREALKFIRQGGLMILTPDGPRGPNEALPLGPLLLARSARCPVFLMGLAARPAWKLGSWDRAILPFPFARAQFVLEGPLNLPAGAEGARLEVVRADWESRLKAGRIRAESLLAATLH